jgi:NCS1 family nucleobase:cation symporter-1
VTSATIVVYDEPIWDPVALIARLRRPARAARPRDGVVVIAQISTNMAANVVSPSNDFSNLSPRAISFRSAG